MQGCDFFSELVVHNGSDSIPPSTNPSSSDCTPTRAAGCEPASTDDENGILKSGGGASSNSSGAPVKKLLAQATQLKDQGNERFQDQNYVAACEAYRAGIETAEAARLTSHLMEAQVVPILVSLHSNMCLALIALKQYRAAKDSADAALAFDSENVKCLLRRGSCLLRLGTPFDGCRASDAIRAQCKASLDLAKADFMHVARLEPQNREVIYELRTAPTLLCEVEFLLPYNSIE